MNFAKLRIVMLAIGVALVSCKKTESLAKTATNATSKATAGKMATASFKIKGMTCAVMCAAKIEKELSAMNGVQKAKVDFDKKSATVEFDDAILSLEKVVEKVESVADGKTYKVSDVKCSTDKAMLFQNNQETQKVDSTKAKKQAKVKAKKACCTSGKHCSKETM